MKISGFQKLTLVDYPGLTSCIVFTQGCNFRCPFCHNSSLINDNSDSSVDEQEFFDYLDKRKNVLDGVCITGGEPLLQSDLESFITKIKEKGYKVKLDTNGSNPIKLKSLIDKNLLDYIAMDIKNNFTKYDETSGIKVNIDSIKKSIEIIKSSKVDYEFRTTIVKELHTLEDLKDILEYIGSECKYYIQNYKDCESVLKKGLSGFEDSELLEIKKTLERNYPNVSIRGI